MLGESALPRFPAVGDWVVAVTTPGGVNAPPYALLAGLSDARIDALKGMVAMPGGAQAGSVLGRWRVAEVDHAGGAVRLGRFEANAGFVPPAGTDAATLAELSEDSMRATLGRQGYSLEADGAFETEFTRFRRVGWLGSENLRGRLRGFRPRTS